MNQAVNMKKFPSIEGFTSLIHQCRYHAGQMGVQPEALAPIVYHGTVKLHGTNGGVIVTPDGTVAAQSREQLLSVSNDNAGFCAFVLRVGEQIWRDLASDVLRANGITTQTENLTLYGEWCGGNIQKGNELALMKCPKHFVIFRAAHGDDMLKTVERFDNVEQNVYNINNGPAQTFTLDFTKLDEVSAFLNKVTAEADECCPWVKQVFGETGGGEGWVWIAEGREFDSRMVFKTKGETHKSRSSPIKDVAPIDVEKVNSIKECIDIVLTENRMNQMIRDHKLELLPTSIGPFLKHVCEDIIKEEYLVIQENNLEWKDVNKLIQSNARIWFMKQISQSILNS